MAGSLAHRSSSASSTSMTTGGDPMRPEILLIEPVRVRLLIPDCAPDRPGRPQSCAGKRPRRFLGDAEPSLLYRPDLPDRPRCPSGVRLRPEHAAAALSTGIRICAPVARVRGGRPRMNRGPKRVTVSSHYGGGAFRASAAPADRRRAVPFPGSALVPVGRATFGCAELRRTVGKT
jgi:hypothetical protein